MNAGDQISLLDLGIWCGKTSPEPSVQTTEKTSEPSSKRPSESSITVPQFLDLRTDSPGAMLGAFWEMGFLSLGAYTTHSFGELPSVAVESRLSQILEDKPHPKYCLSAKACQGILNRAKKRGKVLPPILEAALRQSVSRSEPVVTGGVKESLSNTKEQEHSQPSIIKPSSTVFGISSFDSNAMKSDNPNSGIYQADTSRTLDLNGGNPACNQGGMVVVEGNGSRPSHKGDGFNEGETSYTLNSTEIHAVAFSQDAYDKYTETDSSATLKQSGGVYGGAASAY